MVTGRTLVLKLFDTTRTKTHIIKQIVRGGHFKHKTSHRSELLAERSLPNCVAKTEQPIVIRNACFSSQSGPMEGAVHTNAKDGFKEGSFYDQSRPSYTTEVVNAVADNLNTDYYEGVKYTILELGAGTGKFTAKMLEKLKEGSTYLATDPSESFLSVLKKNAPGVETAVCAATKIPLPDNSVQNIICAQCFHWFATVESMTEMARVLVPNGQVLMVWNNKDWSVKWLEEIENILTEYYDDTPRAITRQWMKAIERFPPLTGLSHRFLPGLTDLKGDKNFVVDHFSSISIIAKLGTAEKEAVRTRFRAVLDKHHPTAQEIQIPLISEFYSAKKT